jgi:uncharacterized protein (DUF885 family)
VFTHRFSLYLFLGFLPFAPLFSADKTPDDPVKNLHKLFDEAWAYRLEQSPVEASYLGDFRNADQWDKLSLSDLDAHQEKYQSFLKKLTEIDREKLPPA